VTFVENWWISILKRIAILNNYVLHLSMALFGFGKRTKHRSFEYTPRYYDPEKDDLDRRMAPYRKKEGEKDEVDAEAIKQRIRGSFKKPIGKSYDSDAYKRSLRKSNRVVMIVMMILVLLTLYFLLEYMPSFFESFD
jgi:hypothetical protein